MNYRALFIISGLILAVGFWGLFFNSNSESANTENTNSQTTAQPVAKETKEQVLITTATLVKDVRKNTLLQAEDYTLNEISVNVDAELVRYNLKDLLKDTQMNSLQGFLVNQNVQSGSILSPDVLLSPKDPRFLVSSLDPRQEVAYRVFVKPQNAYILDTLQNGAQASIYSQQQAKGRDSADKTDLVKIVDNVQVLYSHTFTPEEKDKNNDNFVGYISVKLHAAKAKEFYALARDADLVVLPVNKESTTNHRGMFIRKLRGQ